MKYLWDREFSWVIVYGDLGEGIQGVVGNFGSEEDAEVYAESHNLGHFTKYIFQTERPGSKNSEYTILSENRQLFKIIQ